MVGIFSNAKINFNTGGGTKKAGLVNSWNWPSIPYNFLPRTIAATIQEIIDYLLGLLTTLYGNPTDAATADAEINNFINFVVALSKTSSKAAGVGANFTVTNTALTAGGYPLDFKFQNGGRTGMGETANTAAYITNLNIQLGKTENELERRAIIAEWYLKSGFLGIAADQIGSGSFKTTTAGLNTTVMGLTWGTFYTVAASALFIAAIAAKDAVNVVANSPLNGLTGTNRAIAVQVTQDILDAA